MHTVFKAAAAFTTLAVSGALAASAAAQPAPAPWNPSPSITASLDIGGSGNFTGVFDNNQLCYMLNAAGLANPTAAKIVSTQSGNKDQVVLNLQPPANGASAACAPVAPDLAKRLVKNAPNFALEIDTATYPQGAVRAPLSGANG